MIELIDKRIKSIYVKSEYVNLIIHHKGYSIFYNEFQVDVYKKHAQETLNALEKLAYIKWDGFI